MLHAQAAELLARLGNIIPRERRNLVESLVASRGAFVKRCRYAMSGKIKRVRMIDLFVMRALIVIDCY